MSKNYMLEIYEPKSFDDVWVAFDSDYPLPSIHSGDLLNPFVWEAPPTSKLKILRVINVEHIIWKIENEMKHKLLVYTEDVENTRETRIKN